MEVAGFVAGAAGAAAALAYVGRARAAGRDARAAAFEAQAASTVKRAPFLAAGAGAPVEHVTVTHLRELFSDLEYYDRCAERRRRWRAAPA
jgi:hypothetical protein